MLSDIRRGTLPDSALKISHTTVKLRINSSMLLTSIATPQQHLGGAPHKTRTIIISPNTYRALFIGKHFTGTLTFNPLNNPPPPQLIVLFSFYLWEYLASCGLYNVTKSVRGKNWPRSQVLFSQAPCDPLLSASAARAMMSVKYSDMVWTGFTRVIFRQSDWTTSASTS